MAQSAIEMVTLGQVTTISLNRPERRNALTREMMSDLERCSRQLADDEATRAVVIRAEGRDFSVGVDLAQPRAAESSLLMRRRTAELGGRLIRAIQEIPQPTICAVQGIATGGGACIATACDFRLATSGARMGYGEVRMGMNLMWSAAPICLRLIGPARAKRMIMTGALFDAATLERWGMVDEVAPEGDLDARVRAWADEYASLPPLAVQMIKRSLNEVAGGSDRAVMHMDADQWLLATASEDHREAVSAFFDKRLPSFTGN